MADSPTASRAIDRAALRRWQQALARGTEPPWLHGEVARRMADRLALFKRQPDVVLDWWSASSASATLLRAAYPRARVLAVQADAAPPPAAPWWSARRWRAPAIDAAALPEAQAQLVWANMMLHAVADPAAQMAQWSRALEVEGVLMFSTVGPDTLKSLREIYLDAGWGPPHAAFVDMHDLGDMLVGAGLTDPVMDQERLQLTWATPAAALAELRLLGRNADPARGAGARTPRWRARLEAALAARADAAGRIGLEFEIVYGHAFKPPPTVRMQGETRLGVEALQRMARAGRRG